MLKVLIADAQTLIRKGLIEVLRNGGVAALVGEASTGQETLAMCQAHAWDVVVLDLGLRAGTGLETLAALRQAQPDVPVVMYAENVNPLMARRCLELGAAGYALKGADPLDLICAIEAALGHRHHLSRNITPLSAGLVTLTQKNGTRDE
jgi:two-component system, NarL family, invasion response regulator UvrY